MKNFLRQLKRANVQKADLLRFYISCIRSVCDHAAPVFHASLQHYLIDDLERVQKRDLAIISPTSSYVDAPAALDLELLDVYHRRLSQSLLESILKDTRTTIFITYWLPSIDHGILSGMPGLLMQIL